MTLLEVKTFYSSNYKLAALVGKERDSGKNVIYYYAMNDNDRSYEVVNRAYYATHDFSELYKLGEDYVCKRYKIKAAS